jgi:hypothetical protein
MRRLLVVAAIGCLATDASAAPDTHQSSGLQQASLAANPARVCADTRQNSYLNFDLILKNPSSEKLSIAELRAIVFDRAGTMVERRLIWQQSLALLGAERTVPASGEVRIFNPFLFRTARPGSRIRFEVDFVGVAPGAMPLSLIVVPEDCTNRKRLVSPIAGRLLVYDGYDVYSHHRRSGYAGTTDNFQRFELDLVVVDEKGKFFTGDGSRVDQWLGWGRPVRAPAAGVVAAVHDGQPDNVVIGTVDQWTDRDIAKNPMTSYGNYVLIDHGDGEFTLSGHLRNGSVAVKKGDRVTSRQTIGQIGNSGASGGVHVHFERRTGPGISGMVTLPPSFHDVAIADGAPRRPKGAVAVDSGDVFTAR